MLTFRLCQRRFALKGFADASPEFLLCGPLRPLRLCGEEICHCRETQRYAEIREVRREEPGATSQSSGLRRCVAVYLPTLLPTAVPTTVLLRQCIPPHTRALPSSS
jgi:hypothetical protein